jgi:hypothetical protein
MLFFQLLSDAFLMLERSIESHQQHAYDSYLGRARDHEDLERRLAAVSRTPAWIPHYG